MRRTLVVLVAALLIVPAGHAKTVVVRAGWDEARAMLAGGEYRPKIRMELQSAERVKGKFIEATGAGLRLEQRGSEALIAREDIRTIRLVPRKAKRRTNRIIATVAGIPAGALSGLGATLLCCGFEASPGPAWLQLPVLIGVWIVVQTGLYHLGARADRGAVLIVLDERAPDSSPDPPQVERPFGNELRKHVKTDSTGKYEMKGLPAGALAVVAVREGARVPVQRFTSVEGGTVTADFVLPDQ